MGSLEFVSSPINTLAWPLAVVVCATLFRTQIGGLLHRITTLEAPGVRATFAGGLAKVEETVAAVAAAAPATAGEPAGSTAQLASAWVRLLARADLAPQRAVLDAWGQIEHQLNLLADRLDPKCPRGWPQNEAALRNLDQWQSLRPAIVELKSLRDATAAERQPPSSSDAVRYVSAARELAAALESELPAISPEAALEAER